MVKLWLMEALAEASAALPKSSAVAVAAAVASPNCDWVAAALWDCEASQNLNVTSPPIAAAEAGPAIASIIASVAAIIISFFFIYSSPVLLGCSTLRHILLQLYAHPASGYVVLDNYLLRIIRFGVSLKLRIFGLFIVFCALIST